MSTGDYAEKESGSSAKSPKTCVEGRTIPCPPVSKGDMETDLVNQPYRKLNLEFCHPRFLEERPVEYPENGGRIFGSNLYNHIRKFL